jgi:hypothetical protein
MVNAVAFFVVAVAFSVAQETKNVVALKHGSRFSWGQSRYARPRSHFWRPWVIMRRV